MTVSRTYNSTLREEQMEQTRERLLETLKELFADGTDEVTVAMVAERAKVSVRTAYRYFPTKEALYDGFNVWIHSRIGTAPITSSIEGLPDQILQLMTWFQENERLIRASQKSTAGAELRRRRRGAQVKGMQKALAKFAPQLDEEQRKRIGAAIHSLMGSNTWFNMLDHWGLSPSSAIEATQWAIDAIVQKLETETARKGKGRRS